MARRERLTRAEPPRETRRAKREAAGNVDHAALEAFKITSTLLEYKCAGGRNVEFCFRKCMVAAFLPPPGALSAAAYYILFTADVPTPCKCVR